MKNYSLKLRASEILTENVTCRYRWRVAWDRGGENHMRNCLELFSSNITLPLEWRKDCFLAQ
jgi:hypothetical protein